MHAEISRVPFWHRSVTHLGFYTLPRMKVISCGFETSWGQYGPVVWFPALQVSCVGCLSCTLLTGPQEAGGCCAASDLLRPLTWSSLEDSKEPKGTSGWCNFAEGLFPRWLLDMPPCTGWALVRVPLFCIHCIKSLPAWPKKRDLALALACWEPG